MTSRIRRPTLERNGPSRAWVGAFYQPPRAVEPRASNGSPRVDSSQGAPAYQAVNNAYRVIDEYLRQGQEFAQRAWMPLGEIPSLLPGAGHSLERMMRATGNLALAWLEFLEGLSTPPARSPDATPAAWPGAFATGVDGGAPGKARGEVRQVETGFGVSVVVESSRPVTAHVDLQQGAQPHELKMGALSSPDPNVPALQDIAIDGTGSEPRVTVRIRVDGSQPSGVYNGLLLDRSGRARGTVSVTLS